MSYDLHLPPLLLLAHKLKGHQIIGELRRVSLIACSRVIFIERSPDHWWVTTLQLLLSILTITLKGHQIIGELRQSIKSSTVAFVNWKVTRSLVSYDGTPLLGGENGSIERSPDHWWVTTICIFWWEMHLILKGHQIIGELRPLTCRSCKEWLRLKGHQIIGELRRLYLSIYASGLNWKVTRSLVSYDNPFHTIYNSIKIERSPDHWWVTTYKTCFIHTTTPIERSPDHWWVTTNLSD